MATGQDIVNLAIERLDTPYAKVDCSQLVEDVLKSLFPGEIPALTVAIIRAGANGLFEEAVTPRIGDLVSWAKPMHVAIVVDPESGKFIGSQTTHGVSYSNYKTNLYWSKQTGRLFHRVTKV